MFDVLIMFLLVAYGSGSGGSETGGTSANDMGTDTGGTSGKDIGTGTGFTTSTSFIS